MRNDAQKVQGDAQRSAKGNGLYRTISGYLRIVSSGASTVASSVKSAGLSVASSLAEDDAARDQVQWSGFDKLECAGNILRAVLLLGYRSGFEVWDVEEADNVHQLASRRDGPVSFLQVQKTPTSSKRVDDKFYNVRPLLVVAGDVSNSGPPDIYNINLGGYPDQGNANFVSTNIQFYSLRTHSCVHVLKFRSAIYSVRCSPRVVAILQASQIHCFDAATLEREYTILTYPLSPSLLGSGGIGYGPLAVGSRWLAYSGIPVVISSAGRVSPQHMSTASSLSTSPSNGSLVAQYAKESSKQLASGIATLGDMGYKKLSKYCSELLQDGSNPVRQGYNSKSNGEAGSHQFDMDSAGTVIVRDLISKSVIVQFRAHRSPISALCFDPSGTLLVTASIHGHTINIFRVFPSYSGSSQASDAGGSYIHLYKLQRGFTDAVIQDISFSNDSQYTIISSSRGTSHLFALLPSGGTHFHPNDADFSQSTASVVPTNRTAQTQSDLSPKFNHCSNFFFQPNVPVTLSVVSRIRNGSNGWKGAVSGAAAAAAGRVSPLCGATSSAFHHCKSGVHPVSNPLRAKHHVLVFSPSGCLVQHVLRNSAEVDPVNDVVSVSHGSHELSQDVNSRLVVEAIQKWDVCHKRYRRDHGINVDLYGENGYGEGTKSLPKAGKRGTSVYPADSEKVTMPKISTEERRHAHLSEVELHTHASGMLWTKPEIYFHVISEVQIENIIHGDGEIEIEKVPTRVIEARSKTLTPAFDQLYLAGFQSTRSSNDGNIGNVIRQTSDSLGDTKHSCGSSYSPIGGMPRSTASVGIPSSILANGWDDDHASANLMVDSVHTRDSLNVNNQLSSVNMKGEAESVPQLKYVNNVGSLKMESRFLGSDGEID